MKSGSASALVAALFFLALGISGLITGKVVAKWHIFGREQDPVSFWLAVATWFGAGAAFLFIFWRSMSAPSGRSSG
jgi:hypothetical protein